MFGIRLSRVFASRWHTLGWSVMVLLTAYCAIPEPEPEPRNKSEAKAAAAKPTEPGDPWAGMKEAAKQRKKLLER